MDFSQQIHAKAGELGEWVLRMTTAAGAGHPSSALSLGHIVATLMYRVMRFDPADPWNPHNDRLVLSEGHAVPIVYAAYADLSGVVGVDRATARPLTKEDLLDLRSLNSPLDGHPNPAEGFPFFDAATGSLGQGLSVAAGLGLAAKLDGSDRKFYAIIGDGESREGQIAEAADFIVDHGLVRVCAIFNCNGQGQADYVSKQQSPEVIASKMAAYGWQVVPIDGHDPRQIFDALSQVGAAPKPVAIVARTEKGWGVDLLKDKSNHGKPLTKEQLDAGFAQLEAKRKALGSGSAVKMSPPSPAAGTGGLAGKTGERDSGPQRRGEIHLPPFREAMEAAGCGTAVEKGMMATRRAYGAALLALGQADPRIVVVDGDVSNSTFSQLFAKKFPDRFFECKIAEQNMASVAVGLSAAGKIPFANSFAKFLARAYDQIEMAVITRANVKLVGSHAGVSLASDGPSQMAMADVPYFRSYTATDDGRGRLACRVFHPADAVAAYRLTELMANTDGLCYMRTHRPDAAILYPHGESFDLSGVKQLREGDDVVMASSGYMVSVALEAAKRLAEQGIRAAVYDVYAFPMDTAPILAAADETAGVLTVEDNFLGGLYSALAEAAAREARVRVWGVTVERIPKSAHTPEDVFAHVGVSVDRVVERAKRLLG